MLRNIPNCVSPDLMHALMSMGHGDEIVFADADFPGADNSRRLIRADGVDTETLLNAVLPLFPLDTFGKSPVLAMDCSAWGDNPESYSRFGKVVKRYFDRFEDFEYLDRSSLYGAASEAYAVVVTGEADGNIILRKGIVMQAT